VSLEPREIAPVYRAWWETECQAGD
jgi:hypothetical protein